jgi:protein TonB
MVAEPLSTMKSVDVPAGVSTESDAQTSPSSAPAAILEETAHSAPSPTQMAAISSAPSNAPAKRDYGWLSEAILRRVEELKRYPASARVDRAEGKVVVKAVINEDGNLGEVEVFQSSGYPTLDKAAVETMRQAAPFHLPHPLGQPRITIKIPMSYRLDR